MIPSVPVSLRAHFVEGVSSNRAFCTTHTPATPARAFVLVIPPFAEEMMKSRQQFTQLALRLTALGITTCVLDVRGTGDAQGELSDVTWTDWCDDVKRAYESLTEPALPSRQVFVLGLRMGALLALDALASAGLKATGMVLWEPQFAGKLALKPFLRIGAMSAKIAGKSTDEVASPQADAIEIGGYMLTRAFQDSVHAANAPTSLPAKDVLIIKIASDAAVEIPPAWEKTCAPWRDAGAGVTLNNVSFPAFWTTPEIITSEALIEQTSAWIASKVGP